MTVVHFLAPQQQQQQHPFLVGWNKAKADDSTSITAPTTSNMLGHYGKPPSGCEADEKAFQISGVPGMVRKMILLCFVLTVMVVVLTVMIVVVACEMDCTTAAANNNDGWMDGWSIDNIWRTPTGKSSHFFVATGYVLFTCLVVSLKNKKNHSHTNSQHYLDLLTY